MHTKHQRKYISFSKILKFDGKDKPLEMRFIDSFRLLSSSLGALTKNLNENQRKNLKKVYPNERQFNLLNRKGVYPYDYVDSMDKLAETSLPPKVAFYSRLNNAEITDEDYDHAKKVWRVFGIRTFREYHELYNKLDVLLLADVFQNFRDICSENYDLDPVWYYTSSGLSWDAALKTTKIKLELLSDVDMVFMIQKGIRGGIATVSKRFAQANNKYMGSSYDSSKPSKYVIYLDSCNLYGWAMFKPLPTHGFNT